MVCSAVCTFSPRRASASAYINIRDPKLRLHHNVTTPSTSFFPYPHLPPSATAIMVSQPAPPLDELVYSRRDIIEYWLAQNPGANKPMDENMIYRYIGESPFFDHMSNNGLAIAQAGNHMQTFQMTWDRRAFEDDLKRKRGVEYMISGEPAEAKPVKDVEGAEQGWAGSGKTGVWNVRKQERSFVRARDGVQEDLTTLGTYYLVGENMYQAPSVGDVVGNRLIAATNSLNKFFEGAAKLPDFDPADGYSYLPQAVLNAPAQRAHSDSRSRSASAAPTPSREPSMALPTSESLRSASLAPDSTANAAPSTSESDTTRLNTRMLAQSLQMSLEFAAEYSDENPLLGQPGNFSFTHTLAAVKKRRAEEEAAALAEAEAAELAKTKVKEERESSTAPTPVAATAKKNASITSAPPAVMSGAKASAAAVVKEREKKEERRGSGARGDKKRKKSRASNVLTPGSASGAAGS